MINGREKTMQHNGSNIDEKENLSASGGGS
jgi:hypothetical protein